MKIWKEWNRTLLLLILILIFAFFLRFARLDSFPIFADEAIYIRWAQVMRAEPSLRFLPLSDGKQPLFMWTVIPFFKLFSDPLVAGRMPSVLTGLGSVVGVFVLSWLLFKSKRSALFAGFFYAISPFSVFFDRMALVDSMLTMFGIWYFVFTYLTAKHLRLDTALIAGFALGGAMLTKSPAIFFVILSPLFLLFSFENFKKQKVNILKFFGLQSVATAIGYGFYNILRLGPNFHLIGSRNQDYVYPLSHLFERPLDPFLPYMDRIFQWISIMGPVFILVFSFITIAVYWKKLPREILILLLWFLLPASVVAMFTKAITARYVLFTIPPLFILAGQAFSEENFNKYKKALTVLLIVHLFFALKFNYKLINTPLAADLHSGERSGYLVEWSSGIGIEEAAEKLIEIRDANPGKPIVVGTEGYFGTLPDGLQIYLEKEPNITVIGVGQNISEVPSSLRESKNAGNLTFLVANSSRLAFERDFSHYGLEVVYSVEKPERSEDSHERVPHGDNDVFYLFEVVR